MHLETIIKDLRERFARVELSVSPPLVAFRESVFLEAEAPEPGHKPPKVMAAIFFAEIGVVDFWTSNAHIAHLHHLICTPLPKLHALPRLM